MEKKRCRALFQIHLSTALILMFLTGAWMLVNSVPTIGNIDSDFLSGDWRFVHGPTPFSFGQAKNIGYYGRGVTKLITLDGSDQLLIEKEKRQQYTQTWTIRCYGWPYHSVLRWDWSQANNTFLQLNGTLLNAGLAFTTLIVTWLILERRIALHKHSAS